MTQSDERADALLARKAETRKAGLVRRKTARDANPQAAAEAARRFLEAIPCEAGAIVSGSRPIRTELDPTPLMLALIARGARICAPVIEEAGRPLAFRAWTPETPMTPGAFGAAIPAEGDWLEPTLLIVPLAAFDRQGRRLGYGGGFYDRTLERLRALRPTRAIGFAYAAQECEAVPVEPTDQPLDGIVTEREAILLR